MTPAQRDIIVDVCIRREVAFEDMIGPSRAWPIAHPRQEAMFRLWGAGRWSLSQIGNALGGRHHTTVLHGIRAHAKRVAKRLEADAPAWEQIGRAA